MASIFPRLNEEEQSLYACLAMQHRIGYAGFARLLEVCGSPQAVYDTPAERLKEIHPRLTPESADSIVRGPDRAAWDKILERCHQIGARVTAPDGPGYPETLLFLSAPPPLLFVQGGWISQDASAVAIVGTRNPTAYGRKTASTLARDLAQAGVTVVSGLAVGIDAESHAGALDAGGRTLAIIGCGLDIPYPPENQALRERIAQNGAVLSEFPPGAHPKRDHFPRRNRILSALAVSTVVVEAGQRSGALLTAAHARAQGKNLFAVPGSIFSPVSVGTHALLKRGSFLADSATDLLTADRKDDPRRGDSPFDFAQGPRIAPTRVIPKSIPIPVENEPLLDLWRGEEACGLDRLAERAGEMNLWPPGKILSALMQSLLQLEIRGLVQRLPGPKFRRTVPRNFAIVR